MSESEALAGGARAADSATAAAAVASPSPRPATAALLAAVLLGIAGDALLRAPALGMNLVLWVAAALAATAWVARTRGRVPRRGAWLLASPVLVFAGVFAWRTAEGLLVFNMFAMLSAFGILALVLSGWPPRITSASIGETIVGAASLALSGVFGGPMLIGSDHALADGRARPRWRGAMPAAP